jgi:hypothetical protein
MVPPPEDANASYAPPPAIRSAAAPSTNPDLVKRPIRSTPFACD